MEWNEMGWDGRERAICPFIDLLNLLFFSSFTSIRRISGMGYYLSLLATCCGCLANRLGRAGTGFFFFLMFVAGIPGIGSFMRARDCLGCFLSFALS